MVAFFLQYGVQKELGVFTNHSPWTSRYVSSWGWSGKPRTMCKSNCNSTPITLAPMVAHLQIQQIQPTVTSLAWWLVKIFTPFLYGYGHSFIFKLPVTCWWLGDGIGWVLKFEMSGLHLWYPHFFQKDISWWKFNPVCKTKWILYLPTFSEI